MTLVTGKHGKEVSCFFLCVFFPLFVGELQLIIKKNVFGRRFRLAVSGSVYPTTNRKRRQYIIFNYGKYEVRVRAGATTAIDTGIDLVRWPSGRDFTITTLLALLNTLNVLAATYISYERIVVTLLNVSNGKMVVGAKMPIAILVFFAFYVGHNRCCRQIRRCWGDPRH